MQRRKLPPLRKTMPNESSAREHRLREILSILRKHRVTRGMSPQKLRLICEDLGPTFVKFGQILSMRPDMLPQEYCEELGKLRENVGPMSGTEAAAEVEKEYGTPLREVFSRFDPEPLGSASIAQVHYAELFTGERVVVKIRRPGIRGKMARDVVLLRRASGILRIAGKTGKAVDFNQVIGELWEAAKREMDFRLEADQAEEFRGLNEGIRYVESPRVFRELSTSSVLVMEYMDGIRVDDTEELLKSGYDLREIGSKLAENYMKQIIEDGFFHADPHPGNLRIRKGKIIWLDLGMMGRLSEHDKKTLRGCVSAAADRDINGLVDLMISYFGHSEPVSRTQLAADADELLARYETLEVGSMDLLALRDDVIGMANRNGLVMPPGFSMLGRGLVTLQGVIRTISPEINVMQVMAHHISGSFLEQFDAEREAQKLGAALVRSLRRVPDIPVQLSELLKMGARGQLKVNSELTASGQQMNAFRRMAGIVALGLVEGALLIGSAVLCASDLPKSSFGIPLLGAFGLLLSFTLGAVLLHLIFSGR